MMTKKVYVKSCDGKIEKMESSSSFGILLAPRQHNRMPVAAILTWVSLSLVYTIQFTSSLAFSDPRENARHLNFRTRVLPVLKEEEFNKILFFFSNSLVLSFYVDYGKFILFLQASTPFVRPMLISITLAWLVGSFYYLNVVRTFASKAIFVVVVVTSGKEIR